MANLTLRIDDDLCKQSRLYAVHHDTSVLGECLAAKAVIPEGWQWNPEEVYEERMARWNRK